MNVRYSENAGSAFALVATLRAIGSILGMALMTILGDDASVGSLALLPLASTLAALHKPLLLASLWAGVLLCVSVGLIPIEEQVYISCFFVIIFDH